MPGVVDVDTSALSGVVLQLEARGRNLDRILPAVAAILVSAVDDVYKVEGPGWKEFSKNTHRNRGSMGAAKLLQHTGIMAGDTMGKTGSNWAEAMTNIPYAKYHVMGNARLPKRNPFDLGPFEADVLEEVSDLLLDEVVGG